MDNKPEASVLVCDAPNCDAKEFENEDQLSSHMRKHLLNLKLPSESQISEVQVRVVQETPTTKFLENFSKVPTGFLDEIPDSVRSPEMDSSSPFSLNHNPFDETFRRASFSLKTKLWIPDQAMKVSLDDDSESLNTPSITINPRTKSPEAATSCSLPAGSSVVSPTFSSLHCDRNTDKAIAEEVNTDSFASKDVVGSFVKSGAHEIVTSASEGVTKVKASRRRHPVGQGGLKKILPKLSSTLNLISGSPVNDISFSPLTFLKLPANSCSSKPDISQSFVSPFKTNEVANFITHEICSFSSAEDLKAKSPSQGSLPSSSQSSQPSSSQGSISSSFQSHEPNSSQSSQTTSSSQSSNSSSSQPSGTNGATRSREKKLRGRTPKYLYDSIIDKNERHRVRNREAALRCRERKKEWKSNISSKNEELKVLKEKLMEEENELKMEAEKLKRILLAHKDCRLIVNA